MAIQRFGIPGAGALPFAQAAGAAGWLFVSGQVPRDASGGIISGTMTTQARATLENLVKVLKQAGYGLEDVVQVGVWIDDPRDFGEFNKVYAQFFSSDHAPARVTVQASLMSDMRVEVNCIAYRENSSHD